MRNIFFILLIALCSCGQSMLVPSTDLMIVTGVSISDNPSKGKYILDVKSSYRQDGKYLLDQFQVYSNPLHLPGDTLKIK